MNFCGKIAAIISLTLVFGCVKKEMNVVLPDRLRAVPSDAAAVISGTCRMCLSELDSSHVFRNIGLEEYFDDEAVLAYCFNSSLSPVLVLDADIDTSVIIRVSGAGISMFETEGGSDNARRVIFAVSESTMAAVRRHLSMGTSILDVPGFADAAELVANSRHWAILRNSEVAKVFPKKVPGGYYSRGDVVRLLRNTCEWTCFKWTGQDECEVFTVNGDSDSFVSNMMASLKPSQSRLPGILPSETDMAVDMPMDPKTFRKAYAAYMDATQRLSQYEKALDTLGRRAGVDPVKWESSLDIREVAMVCWEGRRVLLVRPSSKPEAVEPGANVCSRFASALYGFLFRLEDDSFCAVMDGWLVMGPESDVRAFIDAERPEDFEWPSRPLKFALYTRDAMFVWMHDNMTVVL